MITSSDEIKQLVTFAWMPSRIPVRDALVASVPKGVEFPKERIPSSYEQRWYPQPDDSLRLLVPFDGGAFDAQLFQIEPKAWDHTTCDLCNTRIPAMTLCYVTKFDPYVGLCLKCYAKHVVGRKSIFQQILWHAKRLCSISKTRR